MSGLTVEPATNLSEWNDGFQPDSGPSRRDPCKRSPPNRDVHGCGRQCPVNVDSGRSPSAEASDSTHQAGPAAMREKEKAAKVMTAAVQRARSRWRR